MLIIVGRKIESYMSSYAKRIARGVPEDKVLSASLFAIALLTPVNFQWDSLLEVNDLEL